MIRAATCLTSKPASRWSKVRKVLLATLVGLVLALLAGEFGLRWILFHPTNDPEGTAWNLRMAERYADGNLEDDYWKLNSILRGGTALDDAPGPHPLMGWTGGGIDPVTYAHPFESTVGDRQLVLLYGDSYAQCNTDPELCFQGILERSDLGQRYALLNYGVGGYGLDQIYLLLEKSIDRFKDKRPIVIIGILVESDLDRSLLEFRCWPKPRLAVVGEELVTRRPVSLSTREYLAQHPVSIRSYLWRLFLHQATPFLAAERTRWRGVPRRAAESKALNRKILQEIEHELSSRGLQHCFLLFHSEDGALRRSVASPWQEQMIDEICSELAIPLVDTRDYLGYASNGDPKICAQFYGRMGPLLGHHNELGNLVCFEAVRQCVLDASAPPDVQRLADLKAQHSIVTAPPTAKSCTLLDRPATLLVYGNPRVPRVAETSDPDRFNLRADVSGATVAKFDLARGARRFRGLLHTMADSDEGCPQRGLSFSIQVDDRVVLDCAVPPAANPIAIDVDLEGVESLLLTLRGDRGGGGCNWSCIENPRLQ